MYSKIWTTKSTSSFCNDLNRLAQELDTAEAIVIGAGAGLSASAGFTYSGARFQTYFSDFSQKYGFQDMYAGGFYPYGSLEEQWAFWSRNIYINRYLDAPKPVYEDLLKLVWGKEYFVLTTNVDHCFQKAGFSKERLFYTQGDYGLWQCSKPCRSKTYDNEEVVREMLEAQGFRITDTGLDFPQAAPLKMSVPTSLIPRCPVCGAPMTMNLRCDDTFVEDKGWHLAAARYEAFLHAHEGQHILFLELGVGGNTPVIIKYPFWRMTAKNSNAVYACLNLYEAVCPAEIRRQAICLEGDIGEILGKLR